MATIAERIKHIRESHGLSQTEFGNLFGIVKSTVSSYETGNSSPNDKIKIAICKYFDVSMDYLLGTSDIPKATEYDPSNHQLPPNMRPIKMQSLPIFTSPYMSQDMGFAIRKPNDSQFGNFATPNRVAASHPIFADDTYETFVAADADIQADFCLVAQDDSMIGARIQAGDVVFIRSQETVENKQIAAVIIDGVATLKRWHYYPDKAKLVLAPENSAYEPLVYVGDELNSVRCLGLAVCFMSNL